jgi:transposase
MIDARDQRVSRAPSSISRLSSFGYDVVLLDTEAAIPDMSAHSQVRPCVWSLVAQLLRPTIMPKFHAGLDVSDQTTAICVLDKVGKPIFETTVATTPAAIAAALKLYRRSLAGVALESGTKAAWLHKELTKLRFPMVCLDARHAHSALRAKPNKTDRNDARGLATLLNRGLFTTAHIKSDEALRIRVLLSTRKAMQRKALDLQMSVRMTAKIFGAHMERKAGRLVEKRKGHARDDLLLLLSHGTVRASDALMAEVAILDSLVKDMASEDPVCQRLMTIPGVGPITALTFRAAVDDPARFKSSRTIGAYFGLTPRRTQSGQTDFQGRITRRGDTSVRTALCSAASSILTRSKSQSTLRLWALRLREEKGFGVATVACARKLAVIMHRMWVTGEEFDPKRGATTAGEGSARSAGQRGRVPVDRPRLY